MARACSLVNTVNPIPFGFPPKGLPTVLSITLKWLRPTGFCLSYMLRNMDLRNMDVLKKKELRGAALLY